MARIIVISSILSAACYFVLTAFFPMELHVQIELRSHPHDTVQVFWKSKEQSVFTEANSKKYNIESGNPRAIRMPIVKSANYIRLDPVLGAGNIQLNKLCLELFRYELYCWEVRWGVASFINHQNLIADESAPNQARYQSVGDDPQLEYLIPRQISDKVFIITLALSVCFGLLISLVASGQKRWLVPSFILIAGVAFFVWPKPKKSETDNQFINSGKGAPFKEFIYDQWGRPLTDKRGNFKLMLDPFTVYRNFPNQNVFGITTDSKGFRNSDWKERPSAVGIITGGSTAFGWRLTDNKHTLDFIMSQQSGVHFVNMASAGHLIGQELSILVHYGMQLRPNYVISLSGWNDFIETRHFNLKKVGFGYNKSFDVLQDRLYNYYQSEEHENENPRAPMPFPILNNVSVAQLAEMYFQYIEKMYLVSKAIDAKFVLVIQPYLDFDSLAKPGEKKESATEYNEFARVVEDSCKKKGIECINTLVLKEWSAKNPDYFNDPVHLKFEGNEVLATAIVPLLKKNRPQSNSN